MRVCLLFIWIGLLILSLKHQQILLFDLEIPMLNSLRKNQWRMKLTQHEKGWVIIYQKKKDQVCKQPLKMRKISYCNETWWKLKTSSTSKTKSLRLDPTNETRLFKKTMKMYIRRNFGEKIQNKFLISTEISISIFWRIGNESLTANW